MKVLFDLSLGVLLLCLLAPAVRAEVQLPHGEFFKNLDDLQVKVLGGNIKAGRTWYKGEWSFNRAWAPVTLEIPADGSLGGTLGVKGVRAL